MVWRLSNPGVHVVKRNMDEVLRPPKMAGSDQDIYPR